MFRLASRNLVKSPKKTLQINQTSTRNLNLLEYQSKKLLKDCGVSVQNFAIVDNFAQTKPALAELS